MTAPSPVPFLDLAPGHASLRAELHAALGRILDSQRFVLGDEGKGLEAECAAYLGVGNAIGCASGSDALSLALKALDVDSEQAVVTTPQSFFATAGAARRLGARVDFVDVEPGTVNLDPACLRAFLERCDRGPDGSLREPREGKRVSTVIAVDLFGRPCRYEALEPLAEEFGLHLIEDAAQSFGASRGGRRCGVFGRVATFSFYPTKNLGGAGDGGMVTTDDADLAARIRRLRVHGQSTGRYMHAEVGWNSRLDELQAAVVRIKLPHVDAWNASRRAHAAAYDAAFADLPEVRPLQTPEPGTEAIYHIYAVRAQRRDGLREHLTQAGVGCGVYYPLPLHLQECFADLGYRPGDLPVAEGLSQELLALPMYPELSVEHRDRVIDTVRAFYR